MQLEVQLNANNSINSMNSKFMEFFSHSYFLILHINIYIFLNIC